jgi:hypothetical protein
LLDFYRGDLSARRLGVLVKHLPRDSALVRALSGGQPPLSRLEHFLVARVGAVGEEGSSGARRDGSQKARTSPQAGAVVELRRS